MGVGGLVCKNSTLLECNFYVCFFRCLLSLGNIPKAENCLTHSRNSPWNIGDPGRNTALLISFPFLLPLCHFYSWHVPPYLLPPPLSSFLLFPHLYSLQPKSNSRSPWQPFPCQFFPHQRLTNFKITSRDLACYELRMGPTPWPPQRLLYQLLSQVTQWRAQGLDPLIPWLPHGSIMPAPCACHNFIT